MSSIDTPPCPNGRVSESWSQPWAHLSLDRRSPGYCRVTFEHPPINTITATTVAELAELVGLIEEDPDLKVVVLDSANPDFYLTLRFGACSVYGSDGADRLLACANHTIGQRPPAAPPTPASCPSSCEGATRSWSAPAGSCADDAPRLEIGDDQGHGLGVGRRRAFVLPPVLRWAPASPDPRSQLSTGP